MCNIVCFSNAIHVLVTLSLSANITLAIWLSKSDYKRLYSETKHIEGLVHRCSKSSGLAMEFLQSCTKWSIYRMMRTNDYTLFVLVSLIHSLYGFLLSVRRCRLGHTVNGYSKSIWLMAYCLFFKRNTCFGDIVTLSEYNIGNLIIKIRL